MTRHESHSVGSQPQPLLQYISWVLGKNRFCRVSFPSSGTVTREPELLETKLRALDLNSVWLKCSFNLEGFCIIKTESTNGPARTMVLMRGARVRDAKPWRHGTFGSHSLWIDCRKYLRLFPPFHRFQLCNFNLALYIPSSYSISLQVRR
jgi:hypothetical protein